LTPTRTATATATVTVTPTPNPNHIVFVGQGGTNFVDSISGTNITTVHVGDTVEWQWVAGQHSTTSGDCSPTFCTPSFKWDSQVHTPPHNFTFTFTAGDSGLTFNYYCQIHTVMMQGVVSVLP
jgi:plastocyanin